MDNGAICGYIYSLALGLPTTQAFIIVMTAKEQVASFNEKSGLDATLNSDGSVSLCADYAPAAKWEGMWFPELAGLDVQNLKMEVEFLADAELCGMRRFKSLKHLTLAGNRAVHGSFLESLPAGIGLRSIDLKSTAAQDDVLPMLHKFPTLKTVWGHTGQFSERALESSRQSRPDMEVKLLP